MSWWSALYDEMTANVLLETEPGVVEAETHFLWEHLGLSPGLRVLDQCCGTGRLSVALARRGVKILGVDQSAAYIERCRAAARGLDACFYVGDAFEFVPDPPCHAAFNWWTSFGYAATDGDNMRMLQRASDALLTGGVFALDVPNLPGLLRSFQPFTVTRRDGVVLVRDSTLDLGAGVMKKTWTYFLPDGRRLEHHSEVRLYLPHTMRDALEQCGFENVQMFGSLAGDPLQLDSPRCILVGRKGARTC